MNRDRVRKISLIGLLVLAVVAFAYFGLVRRQARHAPSATEAAMKMQPSAASPPSAPAFPQNPQDHGIFIPPEKQQLIGMRSVIAEMGALTKDIRIVGKVSYDETRLTPHGGERCLSPDNRSIATT